MGVVRPQLGVLQLLALAARNEASVGSRCAKKQVMVYPPVVGELVQAHVLA